MRYHHLIILAALLCAVSASGQGIPIPQVHPGGGGTSTASATQGIGGGKTNTVGADSIFNIKNYGAKGDGVHHNDGAMGAPVYASTCSAGCFPGVVILDYRGVNTSTPVDVHGHNNGSSTAPQAPSVTTTVANDKVITIFGLNTATFTPPSAPPNQQAYVANGTSQGNWAGDVTQVSAGASGAVNATDANTNWNAITIALQPATGKSISLVNVSTSANGNVTSFSTTNPGSAQSGDVEVACFSYFSGTLTPPAAFSSNSIDSTSNGSIKLNCYYNVLTAGSSLSDITLTSASATFAAGDVGKLICVATASPVTGCNLGNKTQKCGKVAAFVDANDVVVSFFNGNTGAVSGAEYIYGSDNDAAISATLTAMINGGEFFVPAGYYLTSTTTGYLLSTAVNWLIQGTGAGMFDYQSTTHTDGIPSSAIVFASQSMSANSYAFKEATDGVAAHNDAAYQAKTVIRDLTIQAGIGFGCDGGGLTNTVYGLYFSGIGHFVLENSVVSNFHGDGIFIQPWGVARITNNQIQNNNSYGVETGTNFTQNIGLYENDISYNGSYGVNAQVGPITIINNIIQRNVSFSIGGAPGFGSVIGGNWTEGNTFANYDGRWIGTNFFGNHDANYQRLVFSAAGVAIGTASTFTHYTACVTDETSACTRGNTYASGGANACIVQSNGTNWIVTGAGCF